MMSPEQETGLIGERWVIKELRRRGYKPEIDPDFFTKNCDLRVNGLPIEVKYARPTTRKQISTSGNAIYLTRWQWSISATAAEMRGEWVCILLAQTAKKIVPYVVPGSQIGERSHIQITSHPDKYKGWLNRYRNAWDVIDYLSQSTYLDDGPTYEQWSRVAA
ncbi:MAG: hypothetical protein KDJ52_01765 [Anaerolineae bacterium]|nr:hypothetical protein [Anaerolineae bacterium]